MGFKRGVHGEKPGFGNGRKRGGHLYDYSTSQRIGLNEIRAGN